MLIKELTETEVLEISAGLGEPAWLRDRRQEAFKAFADADWPTNRDEDWRYTNPRKLDLQRELLTEPGDVPARADGIVAAVGDRLSGLIRLVDGGVAGATVCAEAAEQGVVVTDLATAARDHGDLVREHLGAVVGGDGKFGALNLAAFTQGAFVSVPDDVVITDPIAVSVQVSHTGAVAQRVLVVTGRNAAANVYIDHGGDADTTVVEVVEVVVGDNARVTLVSAQDWGGRVIHVGAHRATVGRDAQYTSLEATLGGETVYLRPDVGLDQPGGQGELLGVYFGSKQQHFEHRSVIHHNAAHTRSKSIYKGALQDSSRAAWFGNIRIEPHAKATSSDETNRNMILSQGAKADSIPFLEILTSDVVQCGHHSSVGQVDELQLFYLESRGIPRAEAARLLVFGFFAEVTDRVDLPGVADTVLAEIAEELRASPTALMNQRRSR